MADFSGDITDRLSAAGTYRLAIHKIAFRPVHCLGGLNGYRTTARPFTPDEEARRKFIERVLPRVDVPRCDATDAALRLVWTHRHAIAPTIDPLVGQSPVVIAIGDN
jgi:hypothetical protein